MAPLLLKLKLFPTGKSWSCRSESLPVFLPLVLKVDIDGEKPGWSGSPPDRHNGKIVAEEFQVNNLENISDKWEQQQSFCLFVFALGTPRVEQEQLLRCWQGLWLPGRCFAPGCRAQPVWDSCQG